MLWFPKEVFISKNTNVISHFVCKETLYFVVFIFMVYLIKTHKLQREYRMTTLRVIEENPGRGL